MTHSYVLILSARLILYISMKLFSHMDRSKILMLLLSTAHLKGMVLSLVLIHFPFMVRLVGMIQRCSCLGQIRAVAHSALQILLLDLIHSLMEILVSLMVH